MSGEPTLDDYIKRLEEVRAEPAREPRGREVGAICGRRGVEASCAVERCGGITIFGDPCGVRLRLIARSGRNGAL